MWGAGDGIFHTCSSLRSSASSFDNLPILARSTCVFFCRASVNGSAGLIDGDGFVVSLLLGGVVLVAVAKLRRHVVRDNVTTGRASSEVHSINMCCCSWSWSGWVLKQST